VIIDLVIIVGVILCVLFAALFRAPPRKK